MGSTQRAIANGSYAAVVPPFRLTVNEEGCADCPSTEDHVAIESGVFDSALAAFFGVEPFTGPGSFQFYLEAITGDPSTPSRSGVFNQPAFYFQATPAAAVSDNIHGTSGCDPLYCVPLPRQY
jgi:hypothetical protein